MTFYLTPEVSVPIAFCDLEGRPLSCSGVQIVSVLEHLASEGQGTFMREGDDCALRVGVKDPFVEGSYILAVGKPPVREIDLSQSYLGVTLVHYRWEDFFASGARVSERKIRDELSKLAQRINLELSYDA